MEVLACKTKALINDIGVFEDYIDKKDVYKYKNMNEASKLIPIILENKLPDLTDNGYEKVKDKDIIIVGKRLKEIYESVLK